MSLDDLASRMNPLISALLRSPLHWIASPGLALLTFTGRKSGRRYRIPVGYQQDGDRVTVIASEARKKRWWRNYRRPGPVVLRIRGRDRTGTAWLVDPDSAEFKQRAEASLQRVPGLARVFHLDYRRGTPLDGAQLQHLADEIAIVRIDLDP